MRRASGVFWWSSRRDWRQREVKVVLASLIVAVATVATISLFANHLRQTLVSSATQFLAADRQLESENGEPIAEAWREEARSRGLETAQMVEFSTMVSRGNEFQLVSVKAVNDDYPLLGQVEFQPGPGAERQLLNRGPPPGELWLNSRLLPLLGVAIGDAVAIGDREFTVSGILVREPDARFNLGGLAPKVMMHFADVPSTNIVQPGSRVEYVDFYAGPENALEGYYQWLQPRLGPSHEWESIRDGEAIGESLDKAEGFLLLGGSLAVLLAAVAVAVASRQYALQQRDNVALLKTLGMTGPQINRLYFSRLALWGLIGAVGGMALALPGFALLAVLANQVLERPMEWHISLGALWPALVTAVVALFAFAYPPIRRLRQVPAMQVLRSQPGERGEGLGWDLGVALVAIFGLLWFYSGQAWLVIALIGGLAVLTAILTAVSALIVAVLKRIRGGGSTWRLALVSLYRHRQSSLAQMAVFAMTLMLAATLFLTRSALLEDWQAQLPEDAPNHFLINIADNDVAAVREFLQARELSTPTVYPMVRGRLTEINGTPVRETVSKDQDVNALNRELNLTWMETLPEDNRIVAGDWWQADEEGGISLESELAGKLGVTVGDELTFTIGSRDIKAPVQSVRTVQWDSMRPNFYVAFSPDSRLQDFSATWITAFNLPEGRKDVLNGFSEAFPTVSILEIDIFIERIREIIRQVTSAIESILVMVLIAAALVMAAVVSATVLDRQREGALVRTLGGKRSLLVRSTMLEFALLGFFAGLLGVIAAEVIVWALQYRLFQGSFNWHGSLWFVLPLVSAVMLAFFGRLQLRPVLNVSPMILLRRLEG